MADQLTDLVAAEQQLGTRRESAASKVSGLRARLAELATAAREHVRRGEFDEAEAAALEQHQVTTALAPAEATSNLLDEIAVEASAARRDAEWRRQVVEAEARRDTELEAARAIVTKIESLFNEVQATVRQGFAHEANAREAAGTAHELNRALNPQLDVTEGGMIWHAPMPHTPRPVSEKIQYTEKWRSFFVGLFS